MGKKKIHIISHSFPNQISPYDATFISDHARVFSDDFEVSVTVPTPRSVLFTSRFRKNHSKLITPRNVYSERCYYLSVPKRSLPSVIQWSMSKQVLNNIEQAEPDLIHLQFAYPSGLLAPTLKKHLDTPLVLTVHGSNFYRSLCKPALKKILKISLDQADVIVAVGSELENNILNAFPHLEPKTRVIHNFVDAELFQIKTPHKNYLSRTTSKNPYQLLAVANLRYTKGLDVLIDAIGLLHERVNIKLNVVGRLNDEPEFKQKVFEKIESLDLRNVNFLGPKTRAEITDWLHRSDGFVLPSRREAFGISLLEAMSCGLPVVSTKSGGPEIILNKKFGILVDPENPGQLADAIYKMTQMDTYDSKGQHEYIEEKFGDKRYKKEYKDLYDDLLSHSISK